MAFETLDTIVRVRGDICIGRERYTSRKGEFLQMHAGLPGRRGYNSHITQGSPNWKVALHFLGRVDEKPSNKWLIAEKTGIARDSLIGYLAFLENYFARSDLFEFNVDKSQPNQLKYALVMKPISPAYQTELARYREIGADEFADLRTC